MNGTDLDQLEAPIHFFLIFSHDYLKGGAFGIGKQIRIQKHKINLTQLISVNITVTLTNVAGNVTVTGTNVAGNITVTLTNVAGNVKSVIEL